MRYILLMIAFVMTTSFAKGEIEHKNNSNELFLYTYYSVYRFQAVPFRRLEFGRCKVFYLHGTGTKIPVEHIILKDGKYFVHLEGDMKMDND